MIAWYWWIPIALVGIPSAAAITALMLGVCGIALAGCVAFWASAFVITTTRGRGKRRKRLDAIWDRVGYFTAGNFKCAFRPTHRKE